jgi:hypothetical protein
MHLLVVFWFLLVGLLSACDSRPTAGIEVGNPEVALTTTFTLDYGEKDYSVLARSSENILELNKFPFSLSEVRTYSSYYVFLEWNPTDGLPIWPTAATGDTAIALDFSGKNLNAGVLDSLTASEGILKEIGLKLNARKKDRIKGTLLHNGSVVPFEFSLAVLDSFQLRYHFRQIEKTADKQWTLPIRFYVSEWIKGFDWDQAILENGAVILDESHNIALWNALNERFLNQFSCLSWDSFHPAMPEGNYVPEALAQFSKLQFNWVTNGDFEKNGKRWLWIQQFNGSADTSFVRNSNGENILRIQVKNPGTEAHSLQLIHENIPVLKNKEYKLTFTIKTDISGMITVRVGTYHPPYRSLGLDQYISISPTANEHTIQYTGTEDNPFARLEFNLGKSAGEYHIQNIRLLQLN